MIKSAKAEDDFSYISKAGGAFLEWLEGNGCHEDNATKKMIKLCPDFAPPKSYLTSLSGEGI